MDDLPALPAIDAAMPTAPATPQREAGRLAAIVLGPPGHQRLRVAQTLLALLVFVVFSLVQHAEVELGLIELRLSNWLTLFNLTGAVAFYVLVRGGASVRLSKDPSLTLPQSVFALCSVTWSYAITGAARGAVLSIVILVVMFGMFKLRAREARRLAILAFVMLGAAMAIRGLRTPEQYDPRVELVHFLFSAIVFSATATLAIRLGRLRAHLSTQRAELKRALELNRILATRDSLTGLLNRRAMVELLAQEQPRQKRGSGPMVLAMVDIDWFKRINDDFGHQVGDAVLQRFAELARAELRSGDALARWGGEEFLLMMPGCRHDDARLALERLAASMAEGSFTDLAAGLGVSFSAGIVECDGDEAYAAAIERADRALYRAKELGRRRVEVA